MRDLLATADLDRYAGQFVWLELNYDNEANSAFLTKFGASATPMFFVIDPQGEQVAAARTGAMSLVELTQFLDRGASTVSARRQSPADAALTRGDALLAEKPLEAAKAYREALQAAPAGWPRRELAQASLVVALQNSNQHRECAETAATEAAHMTRGDAFARTVITGMWCVVAVDSQPWTASQASKLEPEAVEALSLPSTVRDRRDELYRTLMYLSLSRNDQAGAANWSNRWLTELDAVKPANDEERSAVDIARVENIQVIGDPKRILPALIASERAMPNDWNSSLRVAQMESVEKDYDQAIAACDRGLTRTPGPIGSSWLLRTKAEVLLERGQKEQSRRLFEEALQAAQAIPALRSRTSNVTRIQQALDKLSSKQGQP